MRFKNKLFLLSFLKLPIEIETSGLELKFVILISTGFNSNIFRLLNLSLLLLISTISNFEKNNVLLFLFTLFVASNKILLIRFSVISSSISAS